MDPVTEQTPEQIEAARVAAAAQSELKKYTYQPTYPEGHDLAGQPMGGEQVIEYDPAVENDLANKLVANNNRMQAEMRRLKTLQGIEPTAEDEPLPPGVLTRKKEAFQRRDLTAAERLQLSKDLLNPEKMQDAFDTLASARIGSNEEFKGMTSMQIQNAESQAGYRFGREHPEISTAPADTAYTNPYGLKTMLPRDAALLLSWCDKRDLYHTYNNLVLAFDRLKKAGLLSETPIAAGTPPKTPVGAEGEGAADSAQPATQPARRPVVTSSALPNRSATAPRAPVQRGDPTWADIEGSSAEQLKAKPAEWKKKALVLFRRQPGSWVERNLTAGSKWQAKLEALG